MGHTIRATTEKSKFGPWPRKCEFKIDFNKGIADIHEELIQLGLDKDIITKPTAMSYEFAGEKWVGMPKLTEAIKDNLVLQAQLAAAIKESWDKKNKVKQVAETPEVKNLKKSNKKEKEV